MINIFEDERIYSNQPELVSYRKFNSSELSKLNTKVPSVVAFSENRQILKMFVACSTTQFYAKRVHRWSETREGEMVDISKCYIMEERTPGTAKINVSIYVPSYAIL